MKNFGTQQNGSILALALVSLAILSAVVAAAFVTLIPRYRSIHQAASWQEALYGAEAGVEVSVNALNKFARAHRHHSAYPWSTSGWTYSDAQRRFDANGERALDNPPNLGGTNRVVVSRLALDVYTRDTTPENNPWFRIRSTARADLPGRWIGADKRDSALRRMNLGSRSATGASTPYVSRTIEALIQPQFRFKRAILVSGGMGLGNSSNWVVDSFDSREAAKSDPGSLAGGVYPSSNAKRQSNGSIASAQALPEATPYGPLIDGNGAMVAGAVQTNGGDNPATTEHENVSGNSGMDQNRITDDFNDDIPPAELPSAFAGMPFSTIYDNFPSAGGTAASPKRYVVNGNLGAFSVLAPASGNAYVEIWVKGTLDIGNGNRAVISIPPNVFATIYVNGNIEFGNGDVNSSPGDSLVAGHLVLFGVGSSGTYNALGNTNITAAVYAPNYDITLSGTVTSVGSVVGKSFRIDGGGNGGFHYDEALGGGGDIASWKVVHYFEDSRADL